MQAGDKNTKYFHAACNTRKRTNRIDKLKNDSGHWIDWKSGLQNLITGYYNELFTSSASKCEEVISCIPQTISQMQNLELGKEVSKDEVKFALFQMHPDKAPCPDGMIRHSFRSIGK